MSGSLLRRPGWEHPLPDLGDVLESQVANQLVSCDFGGQDVEVADQLEEVVEHLPGEGGEQVGAVGLALNFVAFVFGCVGQRV